jgi:hypothetical protein
VKFIGHINGFAAFRESLEEYQPEKGVVYSQLLELVRTTFKFQGFPRVAPGTEPPVPLVFTAGQFSENETSFGIQQLVMVPGGDIVVAVTTEQADMILDRLILVLDEKLGFRLQSSKKIRSHVSNVVVEFNINLEDYITKIGKIGKLINDAQPGMPTFNFKRLTFGRADIARSGPVNVVPQVDPLTAIETADFVIERRAGHSFEENRYFCSAPMASGDHIRILEEIEAIARAESN